MPDGWNDVDGSIYSSHVFFEVKPLDGTGSIALVCLQGRVHLVQVQSGEGQCCSSASICGTELAGFPPFARVAPEDVPHLHTFTICSACASVYLKAGYRERLLSTLPTQPPELGAQVAVESLAVARNQLTLF